MANETVSMSDEKFCESCGKVVKKLAEICPQCGVRLRRPPSGKSKTTAGVLALFLGGLGIHKFYLGKGIQGIIYLLLCWTFIPSIIAFFEAIVFFLSSEESFQQKYG